MRSRRLWLALSGVAILGVSSVSSLSPVSAKVTIAVLDAWGLSAKDPIFTGMVGAFEKLNPGIKVNITSLGGSTSFEKLTAMIAAGIPPDAAFGIYPEFAGRGLILNLKPFNDTDPDTRKLKYFPAALRGSTVRVNGAEFLYTIPGNVDTQPLYRNVDMLNRAGLSHGSEDAWTMTEFLAKAKKLTLDTNGDGKPEVWGATLGGAAFVRCYPYLYNFGADAYLMDTKTDTATKSILDSPGAIKAFDWLQKLVTTHNIVPAGGADFAAAKVAISQNWSQSFPYPQTAKAKFVWDIMYPLTADDGTQGWMTVGNGLGGIMKTSKHPKEAWRFLKYLHSKEYGEVTYRTSGAFYQSDSPMLEQWLNRFPGVNRRITLELYMKGQLPSSYRLIKGGPRADEIFSAEYAKLMANKYSAADFGKTVTTKINTYLATLKK